MALTYLIIGLAVAGVLALWLHLVRELLRLRVDRAQLLPAPTADGWTLGLWYRPARPRRFAEPVVLVHGLANNATFFEFQRPWSLAAYLAEAGFDCYSVDLRGAGASRAPDDGPWDATVDDHVRLDAPAVLQAVRAHSGAARVLWVGHSLGGLVGLAAAGTTVAGQLSAIATIGSPVYFRFKRRVDLLTHAGMWLAPAGRFPVQWFAQLGAPLATLARPELANRTSNLRNIAPRALRLLLANAFAPIWRGVMAQLHDWVANDAFRSQDKAVDYREVVRTLELPVLVTGGTADYLVGEVASRAYFELLTTRDKELVLLGRAHGQREDYGHGDLVIGKDVEHEVYPVLARWLAAHARPAEAPPR